MVPLTDEEVRELSTKANAIRQTIVEMLTAAGSGHTAGPLGMADIFTALYFNVLKHDPKNPDWAERDRLILSNGHIVPVRYAAMAHAGYFPVEECLTLRKFGSRLQGHPERDMLPGMETTSGPLGSGLSQSSGYAYAARMDLIREPSASNGAGGKRSGDFRVYCVMSDGEHEEGNTWEAILFAGKYRLANLVGIMDRNNIQIDGDTENIMPLEPLRDKYEAFNWHVIEVDGHNIPQFIAACDEAKAIREKPTLILAHTIPGKGIREIEGDYRWHGNPPGKGPTDKIPADKQAEVFLNELRATNQRQ
ncbi:transketolase [Candidatus Kaiserbacteria bacterium]|nr:transketolase [Candidatus Kaiserbacteria bacterium]